MTAGPGFVNVPEGDRPDIVHSCSSICTTAQLSVVTVSLRHSTLLTILGEAI